MGEMVTVVCLWFIAFSGGNSTCLTYCSEVSLNSILETALILHVFVKNHCVRFLTYVLGEREHAAGEQICMTHFSQGEMTVYEMKACNEYFWIKNILPKAYNVFSSA